MKKLFILAFIMLSVLVTSCQKEEATNDTFIENAADTATVPQFDETNKELTAWENFPDELKNAERIENDGVYSKAFSYQAGPYGGNGGKPFGFNPPTTHKIHAIALRAGSKIDNLVVYYRRPNGTIYTPLSTGGNGGTYYIYFFQTGEYIKKVAGRSGSLLDRLTITTNKKSFSHGGNGGKPFVVPIPPTGFQILGFFGRSGRLIDNIGVFVHTL